MSIVFVENEGGGKVGDGFPEPFWESNNRKNANRR